MTWITVPIPDWPYHFSINRPTFGDRGGGMRPVECTSPCEWINGGTTELLVSDRGRGFQLPQKPSAGFINVELPRVVQLWGTADPYFSPSLCAVLRCPSTGIPPCKTLKNFDAWICCYTLTSLHGLGLRVVQPRTVIEGNVQNHEKVLFRVCGPKSVEQSEPVMWSEIVGLRTRSVWEQKKIGLGLAGLVLCCETRSCHAGHHIDLEKHSNFSKTTYSFSVLGTSLLWRSTAAFTYLKVKSVY